MAKLRSDRAAQGPNLHQSVHFRMAGSAIHPLDSHGYRAVVHPVSDCLCLQPVHVTYADIIPKHFDRIGIEFVCRFFPQGQEVPRFSRARIA
jgi:hypothetical protein